jgi:hypothetical protein
MLTTRATVILSLLTGLVLEFGIEAVTGRREAWDTGLFWTGGLPVALAVAALIGYRSLRRSWVWTLLIVPGQLLAMMGRSGEIGSLWPLTLAFSSILSAPFVLAAFVGSRFRKAT